MINNNNNNYYTVSTGTINPDFYYTTDVSSATLNTISLDSSITYQTSTAPTVTISGVLSTNTSEPEPKKKKKKKQVINPYDIKIKELLQRARKASSGQRWFKYVKEYVPGKVYEFTFGDDTKVKTVCDDNDEFSLEFAFFIALAKWTYHKQLTPEGYAREAKNMMYEKMFIKIVNYGMKLFTLLQEKERYEEEQERLKKERHLKYIEKKRRRDQRKKDGLKNLIQKAIEDAR